MTSARFRGLRHSLLAEDFESLVRLGATISAAWTTKLRAQLGAAFDDALGAPARDRRDRSDGYDLTLRENGKEKQGQYR
jgi:hypothetical protein